MATEFYVFSEEDDTSYGPFKTFDLATEEVDDDDHYAMIFTVVDGVIDDCHEHIVDADDGEEFERNSDCPYLGMNIDEVG